MFWQDNQQLRSRHVENAFVLPAAAVPASPKHLDFLDGIRGYAAFYVLLLHCMIWGGWWPQLFPSPKIAVDVFMIMSGYLMAYHWRLREYGPTFDLQSSLAFWVKRFFRIAPLYYFLLLFAFIFARAYCEGFAILEQTTPFTWLPAAYDPAKMLSGFTLTSFLMHLSFLFGLTQKYASSTFMPDWSIGLEMQFYATFPLLMLAFRKIGYLKLAALSIVLCLICSHLWTGYTEPSLLGFKLPIFLIGMLVSEANRIFREDKVNGASLLVVAILLAATSVNTSRLVLTGIASLLFLLVSAPHAVALASIVRTSERLLGNRLAHFMADMSYSVYLVHHFFLSLVGGLLLYSHPGFLALRPSVRVAILFLIVLVGSYGVSYVLHRRIELPGIRLGKRLVKKVQRERRPALTGVC